MLRPRSGLAGCGLIIPILSATLCLAQAPPDWVFPGASWATKTPAEMGVDQAKLDAFKAKLDPNSSGVVIKDGYLIYSWTRVGGGSIGENHNWASASKPVIATMLFSAINEGRVASVNSPILPYWPGLTGKDQGITFRNLADQTGNYCNKEAPGAAYAYNDVGTQLFVNTLDKVFGTSDHLVTAGNSRFRDPMQFQDGTLFESGKGRVRSSARDFARMGWMWANRGYWNGNYLLPRSFFDSYMKADVSYNLPKSVTPNTPWDANDYLHIGSYGGGVNNDDYVHGPYGFDWWFNTLKDSSLLGYPAAPPDTFLANGRDGKDCMAMMPSLGLVVAAWNDFTKPGSQTAWGTQAPSYNSSDPNGHPAPDPNASMNLSLKMLKESCDNVSDRLWNVTSGDWSVVGNWSASGGSVGLPNSLRRARVDNNGTCNITTGTATAKVFYVGDQSAGTAAQSGGTLNGEYVVVGYQGKGVYNHSGGTVSPSGALHVGYFAGSTGIYLLSGGGVVNAPNEYLSGVGRITQSGGLNAVAGTVTVGSFAGSSGTYQLQGGSLAAGYVVVGNLGTGVYDQTGGSSSVSVALHVGYSASSTGTYQLSGGGVVSAPNEYLSGVGRITQSGGLNAVAGTVTIGSLAGSNAAYQLQGGTLKVPTIRRGAGSGSFQFTGGTLMTSSFQMDLTNGGGVLCPGQSVGSMTVAGNFQQISGKLEMELAAAGSFDTLTVTGSASLGGTLNVPAAYRPKEGDGFGMISAGSFANEFASFTSNIATGLPAGSDAFSGEVVGSQYVVTFDGFTAGDSNGNHVVDFPDLSALAANWNQSGQWEEGDYSGDGTVGFDDLAVMAANWGWSKPTGAPVPEPASLAVLLAGGLALLRRR